MPAIVIIITAFMLFLGAAPLPYYPYYPILRFVVTIVFIWAAYVSNSRKRSILSWIFFIGAILFNPIFPIELPKLIWFIIDIACGVFLLVNLKILQKNAYKFKNHTFEYGGDIKDGLANGQGKYNSSSGDKYVGEFKDNNRHGQGTYTFSNGDMYVGEFKDDKEHGQGTFTWSNGDKYVGEFKDNKKNGQGKVTSPGGDKYEGEWKDDEPDGQGTLALSDGEKYVGEFKDGYRNGQGTETDPDGWKYEGEWKDGKKWNGTQYDKDGNITEKYVNGEKKE